MLNQKKDTRTNRRRTCCINKLFVKKTQKTPRKEIKLAERLKKEYLIEKRDRLQID